MFRQIKDKIYEKLSEIEKIWTIKPYVEIWPSSYPAVMFEPYQAENESFSLSENQIIYKFKIYIFQEFSTISKQQAWDLLLDVYDDIVGKLRENFTLDNLCTNIKINQWEFGTTETEDGKTIYGTIYLSVYAIW